MFKRPLGVGLAATTQERDDTAPRRNPTAGADQENSLTGCLMYVHIIKLK